MVYSLCSCFGMKYKIELMDTFMGGSSIRTLGNHLVIAALIQFTSMTFYILCHYLHC